MNARLLFWLSAIGFFVVGIGLSTILQTQPVGVGLVFTGFVLSLIGIIIDREHGVD